MGLELTTARSRATCSTHWTSQAPQCYTFWTIYVEMSLQKSEGAGDIPDSSERRGTKGSLTVSVMFYICKCSVSMWLNRAYRTWPFHRQHYELWTEHKRTNKQESEQWLEGPGERTRTDSGGKSTLRKVNGTDELPLCSFEAEPGWSWPFCSSAFISSRNSQSLWPEEQRTEFGKTTVTRKWVGNSTQEKASFGEPEFCACTLLKVLPDCWATPVWDRHQLWIKDPAWGLRSQFTASVAWPQQSPEPLWRSSNNVQHTMKMIIWRTKNMQGTLKLPTDTNLKVMRVFGVASRMLQ